MDADTAAAFPPEWVRLYPAEGADSPAITLFRRPEAELPNMRLLVVLGMPSAVGFETSFRISLEYAKRLHATLGGHIAALEADAEVRAIADAPRQPEVAA